MVLTAVELEPIRRSFVWVACDLRSWHVFATGAYSVMPGILPRYKLGHKRACNDILWHMCRASPRAWSGEWPMPRSLSLFLPPAVLVYPAQIFCPDETCPLNLGRCSCLFLFPRFVMSMRIWHPRVASLRGPNFRCRQSFLHAHKTAKKVARLVGFGKLKICIPISFCTFIARTEKMIPRSRRKKVSRTLRGGAN